jgi:glycosyltransferase
MTGQELRRPLIAVITVCFNAEDTVGDTLASVAAQDVRPDLIEHIVIDGGSTDRTAEIVKQYPTVRLVSEPDEGIADAFNKGVLETTGEWLLFLNADDFLADKDVLAHLMDQLPRITPQVQGVYGRVIRLDRTTDQPTLTLGRPGLERWLVLRMTIPHQGLLLRREYFDRFGLFDKTYAVGMDYEHLLRGHGKVRIEFIPVTIAKMRCGGVSSRLRMKGIKERYKAQLTHKINGRCRAIAIMLFYLLRARIFSTRSILVSRVPNERA